MRLEITTLECLSLESLNDGLDAYEQLLHLASRLDLALLKATTRATRAVSGRSVVGECRWGAVDSGGGS